MATFPAISIEGGLLGPDVLEQLLSGDLPGQKAADFGIEGRRALTDEIAAAFADGRALWGVFQHRLQRLPADDSATTPTRDGWTIPLLGLLGYELTYNPRAYEIDGRSFAISHRAGAAEEAPPVHLVGARQDLGRVRASGRPRLAPHSLVQEYLNRTEHLWGVASNGLSLRLLRNSTFVRRQSYVEFDLQAIFDENRFQDFAAFYRLLHRSRLPRGLADTSDCLLEQYHTHSVEQGGRVREHLRDGVEDCLLRLAAGFLAHPANDELRRRVAPACSGNERLSAEGLYRQLLRLVYRFLFLLVSEDRGLLGTEPLYHQHYGVGRLRRIVDQRAAYTEHDDLWQSLRLLWRVLTVDRTQPMLGGRTMAAVLGLPVLNGELFERLDLDDCSLANSDLLQAFWRLAWYQESRSSPPRRVNYAALDVEELGSVYESLLEFHPALDHQAGRLPTFRLDPGAERKTTGSYYTAPELVAEVIKSALEPVLAERLNVPKAEQAKAIHSLRVCDPACGSGHFLLAAARHLGRELARVQTGDDEPAPERVRAATREVVAHCIYGVDKNPLAVDLCRVALWLESHTPDKPLTFLDHRIRCGDSLVGVFDLKVLAGGVPNEAFEPRPGDDKAVVRELRRRNREERGGQSDLLTWNAGDTLAAMTRSSHEVNDIVGDSPEEIRRKRQRFEQSHADERWRRQKEACDLWTAAFFQPLTKEVNPAISSDAVARHLAGRQIDPRVLALAVTFANRQRFFHWPLEFPEVFADGGFDVVLSNPPWEQVELKEQEFFAARDPSIALAPTKAARTRLIRLLPETNPQLHVEYIDALRAADASRQFLAASRRFPLAARGRVNSYAVFTELAATALKPKGRTGLIIPIGIATDDTTKLLFGSFVSAGRLADLVGFENEDFIFPAVHHAFKFCKLTVTGVARPVPRSRIAFYVRRFPQLAEEWRYFTLEKGEFLLLNPNTGNCPIFRSQADAELTKAIYRRVSVLWREAKDGRPEDNPWKLRFSQGLFNMALDSGYFRTAAELERMGYRLQANVFVSGEDCYLPLYEAKMLHQFDHRFSTYEGATERQLNVGILPQPTVEQKRDPSFVVQPRYWVRAEEVKAVAPDGAKWFLGWRDITNSGNERTLVCSAVHKVAVGHKFMLMFSESLPQRRLCLEAILNSFVVDYCARQKLGGTSFSYFIIRQLPVPSEPSTDEQAFWTAPLSIATWILPRVLELTYTAYDVAPIARDCSYESPPFVWDAARRFEIRCELDAALFHLHLPGDDNGGWRRAEAETPEQLAALQKHFPRPRDAVAFILDRFPIVKEKDEQAHGRYRTKERILEIYDAMHEARRTGGAYKSQLKPPPGVRVEDPTPCK
jgi:hypothetical protein